MILRSTLRLAFVAALIGSLLFVGAVDARADEAIEVTMICGFADPAVWNSDTEKNAYDTTIVITAPESVAPGETFDVTVDAEPMKNGPVAIRSAGDAVIAALWDVTGSTSDGLIETDTWENTGGIGVLEEYDIDPLTVTLTAGESGSVDLEWQKFQLLAIGTITLVCSTFETDGSGTLTYPTVSIPISGSSTGGGDTTTTTEAASEDTTTTTTTAAAEQEASEEPYVAQVLSKAVDVTYSCATEVNGEALEPETVSAQAVIAAVDKVNPGQEFTVGIQIRPGPDNGDTAIDAGMLSTGGSVAIGGAADVDEVEVKGSSNTAPIEAGQRIEIAPMQSSVTAAGEAGQVITLKPGMLSLDIPSQETAVICEPQAAPVALSVKVVSEPVDLQNDGELPFTGLGEFTGKLIIAGLALYFGYLFLSTLPRGSRGDEST